MAGLEHIGTWFGGSFDLPTAAVSIRSVATADGAVFEVSDFAHLSTTLVSVAGAGAPQGIATQWHVPEDRIGITVGSASGSLPGHAINNAFTAWTAGERSAELSFLGQGAQGAQAVSLMAAQVGGMDMLLVAGQGGPGLACIAVTDGLPGAAVQAGGATLPYSADISDMVVVETTSATHLFAGSASGHGIAAFTFGAGGALVAGQGLGMQQSLPVQTVTALDTVQVGGRDFLIAAAAGSSSLSVMAVGNNGSLAVTDHLIDDLTTRFQGVALLETVQIDGHAFVLAAGMDDGLSLFRLTAEGRLVHQDSIADTTAMAMQAVSGLGAMAGQGGIDVLTTSANEPGVNRFHIAFGAPGLVTAGNGGTLTGTADDDLLSLRAGNGRIVAGAGQDILSDGAGQDSLQGGAGRDIFVLRADGQPDVIEDMEPGLDLIYLSAWPMLYSAAQIQMESADWGATLRFGTEELMIHTASGETLKAEDLPGLLAPLLSHVDVTIGALQLSGALPGDDPFVPPETEMLPDPEPAPEPTWEPPAQPDPAPEAEQDTEPVPGGMVLIGTAGNDTLQGGADDDVISGAEGNDVLDGGAGDDTLAGAGGNDLVRGGPGNDALGGGPGNDTMEGGLGNDAMGGGLGDDTMDGGAGDDLLSGGPGDDFLTGGAGNDMLAGSFGNDTVEGGGGDDNIGGGTGRDDLRGGDGNDSIGGGEGDDTVEGGQGHDFLAGGGRDDLLSGRDGADTLNGGTGNDTLRGGGGADLFVFNQMNHGEQDVIADFTPGVDVIRLHGVAGGTQSTRFDALSFAAQGQDVLLSYEGHEILLRDMALENVQSSDFLLF